VIAYFIINCFIDMYATCIEIATLSSMLFVLVGLAPFISRFYS